MQSPPHPLIDDDNRAQAMRAETALRRDGDPIALRRDDYLVEGDREPEGPTVGARIIHGLQIITIIVIAALSLAIFWVVGLILHIF
jgi:hypothetical protein